MKTIALVGNPNVGKTTLFNKLTGSNQRVGNWSGVTVERKEGSFDNIKLVDLPGIYAMDAFSNEEKISKNFLETEPVDAILNIVDGTNFHRNLYLTMELKKFNIPIIIAVNMADIMEKRGVSYDFDKLSKTLNCTIIPIVASKGNGIDHIRDIISNNNYLSTDTTKYNFQDEKAIYDYIEKILFECENNKDNSNTSYSDKLDNILLNPFLAYPIFIAIMLLTFQITFSWIGQPLSDLLDGFLSDSILPFVTELLSSSSSWFQSLIVDGIVAGVGGILVLLPIILSLFLCITILEDSGYMARVAFIMDSLMRKMGLSGKAFIPMIVGFGCTVPAIMSARTLESEKDRKLTALLVPLMSCGAKLPVYSIFAQVFFPDKAALVVASLYFLGIILAFIFGIIFKNSIFKNDEQPFIIELPEYKVPSLSNLLKQLGEKAKGFLIKAGTIIFAMSVVLWFLSNFNFSGMVDIDNSFLASIGGFIAPIFKPLGFGNWQSSVSLLTGILAKETVVTSMEVIFLGDLVTALPVYFTTLSAFSFLTFILLYTPCVSVIGVMKKEFGTKMMVGSIIYQLTLAWVVSFLIYNIGSLLGMVI